MKAGDMDKDAFCDDYKEHGDSILLSYFYHHSNMLETQKKDLDSLKNEIACFLLVKADDWDDKELRAKAVELIGEKEVILRKIELGIELWNEDKSYIKDNITKAFGCFSKTSKEENPENMLYLLLEPSLTDEQKELALDYAQNLSLFLNDGMFQFAEVDSIPALGDVRFTDGAVEVVYYNQYDERYADQPYGTDPIGGYGCGPTAMAIVVSSLTDDMVDPIEMAKWSYDNGYWCSQSGSYHALIPAAAREWGLPVEGCPATEPQRIVDALGEGKLVVALMAKGHFTTSGHFIVLRGVEDEKILVADPASTTRSQKAWDLSIIVNEASRSAVAGGPFWIIG